MCLVVAPTMLVAAVPDRYLRLSYARPLDAPVCLRDTCAQLEDVQARLRGVTEEMQEFVGRVRDL
jgi:hypothetical protein